MVNSRCLSNDQKMEYFRCESSHERLGPPVATSIPAPSMFRCTYLSLVSTKQRSDFPLKYNPSDCKFLKNQIKYYDSRKTQPLLPQTLRGCVKYLF
jgi:hypothetical protein